MSLNLPKITIITPSYNQGRFLEKTICSVLRQDYPNFEYMVLDGGSTDNSRQIIEKYAEHFSFWRSERDGGQAAAIAEGFKRATGEILCWVNSDDMLLPGALSHVGRLFTKHENKLQWLIGGTVDIDKDDRIMYYRKAFPVSFKCMVSAGYLFSQPSTFWRKSLYEQVGGFDTKLQFCFDYDLFTKFNYRVRPKWTLKTLSAFRHHTESKTSRLEDVRKQEHQLINEAWGVKVPQYRQCFYWVCLAMWGKLTTRAPKNEEFLKLNE